MICIKCMLRKACLLIHLIGSWRVWSSKFRWWRFPPYFSCELKTVSIQVGIGRWWDCLRQHGNDWWTWWFIEDRTWRHGLRRIHAAFDSYLAWSSVFWFRLRLWWHWGLHFYAKLPKCSNGSLLSTGELEGNSSCGFFGGQNLWKNSFMELLKDACARENMVRSGENLKITTHSLHGTVTLFLQTKTQWLCSRVKN